MKNILSSCFTFIIFSSSLLLGRSTLTGEFPHAFVDVVQEHIDATVDTIQEYESASCIVGPISLMSKTASLAQVKKLLEELERLSLTENVGLHIDAIRIASLEKLAVPLVVEMNKHIMKQLESIDALMAFWKEADEYYVTYFLHAKTPSKILRKLEHMQEELYELLGSLVMHVNSMPFDADAQIQYEWVQALCNTLHSAHTDQHVMKASPIFEAVTVMLSKAITSVENFPRHWNDRLHEYQKPSFIRRHLGSLIGTAAVIAGGGPWVMQKQDEIKEGALEAGKTIKRVASDQAELVREALLDQSKGLADIAQRRREIGEHYRDYLYGQLLEYSSNNEHRKQAMIYAMVQQSNDADVQAAQALQSGAQDDNASAETSEKSISELLKDTYESLSDQELERAYKRVVGRAVPQVKKATGKLVARDYDFLTPEAIEQAAHDADPNFLAERMLPLLLKTLQEEGGDAKDSLQILGPITKKIVQDLEPVLETLGVVNQAETKIRGIWNALTQKKGAKGAALASKAEADAQKDVIEYEDVAPHLTEGLTPPLRTGLSLPTLFTLVGNSAKLSVERLNWQFKWVKAIALGAVASVPVYGAYKIGSTVHSRCKKKSCYDGLLEILRELKKLFLVNGDKQQSEMDPADVGLMHYLLYKLERESVPKKFCKAFRQDVRLVQKPDLSADKKYNLVNVIQEGYPFLRSTMNIEY